MGTWRISAGAGGGYRTEIVDDHCANGGRRTIILCEPPLLPPEPGKPDLLGIWSWLDFEV
jgi:hypothetical protein